MRKATLNTRAALLLAASVAVIGLAPTLSFAACPPVQSAARGKVDSGTGQDSGDAAQLAARGKVDSGTGQDNGDAAQLAARGKVDSGTSQDTANAAQLAARGKEDSGTGQDAPQLAAGAIDPACQ